MTKQCGDCTLCCKLMQVSELEKPGGTWCSHVTVNAGCGIYRERPASCRSFRCLWLMDPLLDEAWKPNKCKMVIAPESDRHVVVQVDPGAHQPWLQEPYFSTLRRMSAKAVEVGGTVTIMERGEATVILPDRGVKLGKLGPGDRVVVGKVKTATGTRIEVTKVTADQAAAYDEAQGRGTSPKT